jgi:predicted PhzF superfamily epimerase YddE/YHI9
MTSLPFFQVDAFADGPLTGNPAAVMPLDKWLEDATMQAIAEENNLSETAFTVPSERDGADYDLRWFTPMNEVELCGHATLAAGHVLIHSDAVRFATQSGILVVSHRDDVLELDLPAAPLREVREPELCRSLGLPDLPAWLAEGCNDAAIIEVADETAVRAVRPRPRGSRSPDAPPAGNGSPPTELSGWGQPVAQISNGGEHETVGLPGMAAQSYLIWITTLPHAEDDPGRYQMEISDVRLLR